MTHLMLQQVTKSFGDFVVIPKFDLSVPKGQVLGILGPNGAGKTTLLNLIAGDLTPNKGTITFAGKEVSRLPTAQRCRMGIGRTSQIPRPLTGMTVYENVLVGCVYGAGLRERDARPFCLSILEQTGLFAHRNKLAGELRLLERKRLELARALATKPTLLLLDEIAGGLTDREVQELIEIIRSIKADGMTIIWIEHIVHALLSVADEILAINFGEKLAQGKPREVVESEAFRSIYFGVESVGHSGEVLA